MKKPNNREAIINRLGYARKFSVSYAVDDLMKSDLVEEGHLGHYKDYLLSRSMSDKLLPLIKQSKIETREFNFDKTEVNVVILTYPEYFELMRDVVRLYDREFNGRWTVRNILKRIVRKLRGE